MKYLKSFFIVVLLMTIYLITQISSGVGIGLFLGFKYALEGMPPLMIAEAIESFVLTNTNILILISNMILFFTIVLLFLIKSVSLKKYLSFKKIPNREYPMILCYALSLQLLGALSVNLVNMIYPLEESIESMTNIIVGENLLFTFLMVGLLAPSMEEIFFRGIIFNKVKNNTNLKFAVIIQALVFALIHMNMAQFLPTFLLACTAAIFYDKTKSILWPIALHVFYNTYAIISVNLSENGQMISVGVVVIASLISLYTIYKSLRLRKLSPLKQE